MNGPAFAPPQTGREPASAAGDAGAPDHPGAAELCGLLTLTPDGGVLAANPLLLEWVGRTGPEVIGWPVTRLLTPTARLTWETQVAAPLLLAGRADAVELALASSTGSPVPVLLTAQTSSAGDEVHAVLFHAGARVNYERQLVTARRSADRTAVRLRVLHKVAAELAAPPTTAEVAHALQATLAGALAATSVTVWLHDHDDEQLHRAAGSAVPDELSPLAVSPTGVSLAAAAVRARDLVAVESPEDCARSHPEVSSALAATRIQAALAVPLVVDGEVIGVYQLAFKRARPFDTDDRDLQRTVAEQAGQALQRARLQQDLSHLALHDPLTGLPNRSLFFDRLGHALAAHSRSLQPSTVMMIDLDGFKLVNDGLGHAAGDVVLREVARRLQAELRPTDTVARLGGDEFAVLCLDSDQREAEELAVRIERAVRRPIDIGGDEGRVTASVGVVVQHPSASAAGPDAAHVLQAADAAMYAAKRAGKAQHTVYDTAMRAEVDRRARTEGLIRRTLEQDQLVVHYQPVYDLRTGRPTGVEALCRLPGPDGELVSPAEFIDVAEEHALIGELGNRVLHTACAQLAAWHDDGLRYLDVAVNVAAQQASQPGFPALIASALADTGCPPERLVLELTESALLAASAATVTALHDVRALGVGIALDDFGTRYASLHYVQQFPITELKIDRSFVAGLPHGRAERAIVAAVAGLSVELDLVCVAEGIETQAQAAFLSELGVRGQGYHLGRPSPAAHCAALLRRAAS